MRPLYTMGVNTCTLENMKAGDDVLIYTCIYSFIRHYINFINAVIAGIEL